MEAYGFSFARDSVCRIVGGGTASKLWVQILADITGVKLSYMVFCPNWQNHELYNRYYEIYKHVYTSVKDDMHMLAGLGFSFE